MGKWLATVAAAAFATASPGPTLAAEYLLGPQDKVRLKIYEWRPSRDEIFEWTALNDEFVVGADGTIFLPFAGQIRAQGTTPGDLARSVGGRLMEQMGLGRKPDVAVEIIEFRPFYIVGHVAHPGEFPYRPGLTVLQAQGIAGGLRTREENLSRLQREAIAGHGDMRLLALTQLSLLVRKARLEAELDGKDEIAFPAELAGRANAEAIAMMMKQEGTIFATRKEALSTQLRALRELRDFLVRELVSLEKQLTFHDRQVETVEKELAGVAALVQKGLVTAPRELSLERTIAQMQSDRLATETSLLRVRQEMSKTDIAILELGNRHANEVAQALRETQLQIEEAIRRADTTAQLLYETEVTAPALLASREQSESVGPVYRIVRATASGMEEFTVNETAAVEPGDTVRVEIPLPRSGMAGLPAEETSAGTFRPSVPLN